MSVSSFSRYGMPVPARSRFGVTANNGGPSVLPEQSPVEDDFFHPKNSLTSNQVMGVFSAGLALTLLGLNIKTLFKKPENLSALKTKLQQSNSVLGKAQINKVKTNILSQFGDKDALSSSYRLAMFNPRSRAAVVSYIGTMMLGYLGGSLVKGIQEAWVRRQETLIRANLINRLQDKFRQSIQAKQDMDTELRRNTEAAIYKLLCEGGVPDRTSHDLVVGMPVLEPINLQRLYAYYPVSRTMTPSQLKGKVSFGERRFGILTPPHSPEIGAIDPSQGSPRFWEQIKQHKALNAALLSCGVVAGGFIHQFSKLFSRKSPVATIAPETVVTELETLFFTSNESWFLKSFGKRDQMLVLAGFFGMTALAKIGKLFVDGVREVEVTRRNSGTEYLYQTHNWLVQDPAFHKISEEEAVKHELALLKEQLPYLANEPEKLQERIMVILSNIGRNSAPKYFPMTPAVNLVEARG